MDIDDLTLGQLKEMQAMACGSECARSQQSPIRVGSKVLIRTVTHYYTGRVVDVTDTEVVIEDAAWIADTGRFGAAVQSGSLVEIEPYPDGPVVVMRGAMVDAAEWRHELPRVAKP